MSPSLGSAERIREATALAHALATRSVLGGASRTRRERWLAIGDPQTSPETLFKVLDDAGALGDDGRLRPDVGLVSMGDHFDFGGDVDAARRAGPAVLAWLAAHPRDQVVVLAGNHDLVRVCELAFESDESFAAARSLALEVSEGRREPQDFHERFPAIPTHDLVLRDFAAFSASQRELVQRLLLEERVELAAVARRDALGDQRMLLVHTAVTTRELAGLGLGMRADARAIADALRGHLRAAVARVAGAWRAGVPAALDLGPIHVPGRAGVEGGGFLYHRPGDPDLDGGARRSDYGGERPRRFDPRSLPIGIAQIVGHDPHSKRAKEMAAWTTPRAKEAGDGHLRTLQRAGDAVTYDLGLTPHAGDAATMYLIDAGLGRGLDRVPLMELDEVSVLGS